MASKRNICPEGDTPGKPEEKVHREGATSRKSLFGVDSSSASRKGKASWSHDEEACIVRYIALYWESTELSENWPRIKSEEFWSRCAEFVSLNTGSDLRSGSAVRSRVTKSFVTRFPSIEDAENFFKIDYMEDISSISSPTASSTCKPASVSNAAEVIQNLVMQYGTLSKRLREQLITALFNSFVSSFNDDTKFSEQFPPDFITKCITAVLNLYTEGKDNLVYHIVNCFQKRDNSDPSSATRLPMDRMPFGLVDYVLKFFSYEKTDKLVCSKDYKDWQTTMYSNFGEKWVSLHRGPAWQYDVQEDSAVRERHADQENKHASNIDILSKAMELSGIDDEDIDKSTSFQEEELATDSSLSSLWSNVSRRETEHENQWGGNDQDKIASLYGLGSHSTHKARANAPVSAPKVFASMQAKVNVPGLSARSLRTNIQAKGFKKDTCIKEEILETIAQKNPGGRFWIKADACDVNKGLRESMQHKWSGDTDLGDGSLQELYDKYLDRRKAYESLGRGERKSNLPDDLIKLLTELEEDHAFLIKGEEESREAYNKKVDTPNTPQENLFALAWEVEGFKQLLEKLDNMKQVCNEIMFQIFDPGEKGNIQEKLTKLRENLLVYVQQLFVKFREAASHLLVFMIAAESRDIKPYAVLVRALPFKGISDAKVRELRDQLVEKMQEKGLVTVGFVTDGEWNSIRTQGSKRPISVIQLQMNALAEAKSIKASNIKEYLKINPATKAPFKCHPAIPLEDVLWLDKFLKENSHVEFAGAIFTFRRAKFFPFNYDPHRWRAETKSETEGQCLKAIMAQYLYLKKIKDYKAQGINFVEYGYVPETTNGEALHEREDHGHLLKRLTACFRGGNIPGLDVRRFAAALKDPDTGLTKQALTGERKQSVPDCERLWSVGVLNFMRRKGSVAEAEFVELVLNWHKAVDGRGISECVRSMYIKNLLTWLLSDMIPGHAVDEPTDFRNIDVCRRIVNGQIRGLTREIVVGLLANLTSFELRRNEYRMRLLPPEHPRSGTSDDVECFFSVLHDMLGDIFDLKKFYETYPKILVEFDKQVSQECGFYYWTGKKERFRDFALDDFNQPSKFGKERLDQVKITRRADPGVFLAERAALPVHNSLTARARFHKAPEQLPEPPNPNQ